ncbi:LTA synthase family protein [Marinospirillum minutulum]|uniref:LTA synthase family protein n=1 Tax=Marinospirillum minutulum TaxID=64974 RepID=UPI00041BB463|nr:alkaline phosphatase family protein [Marinospirillum minutulum]
MGNLILTPLRILFFSFFVFALIRLIFLFYYPDYFSTLSFFEISRSFLVGMRFDAAITTVCISFFLLPIILPFNFEWRAKLVKILLWSTFVVLVILWTINLGDMLYFGEVYRHAGRELLLLTQDFGMFFELALSSRLLVLLISLPVLLVLALLWKKLVVLPSTVNLSGSLVLRSFGSILIFLIMVIAGRGGVLTSKPLSFIDANKAGNEQQTALALNGAFAVIHAVRLGLDNKLLPLSFYTEEALTEKTFEYASKGEDPFVQHLGSEISLAANKNIVIILLESWSSAYIDGLAASNYGVTPNMDKLISESRVWENAFAAGQRSIEGIQAVLTSVPLLVSQPVIGWGLEQNRMTSLATLLRSRGYQSVMMQSSNRRSYHMDGVAAAMGFDYYFGKEDLGLRLNYPVEVPSFGWDYEALMHLADFLENKPEKKPFLAFLFTGTTHEPFPDPGEKFHRYEHTKNAESAYLNTLFYSDWALGEFMQSASKQAWYQDTVFVFVADHVLRASATELDKSFRIPLVIYTPDQSLQPGREAAYASQYDVLPTLVDLLGITEPIASFGRSLLRPVEKELDGVMVQRGQMTGWLSPLGWFGFNRHSEQGAFGAYVQDEIKKPIANWLKWRMQLADQRLIQNEWLPSEPASLVTYEK